MKEFLIKLSVFGAIISGIVLFILVFFGGYVDFFYEKFTSPPQKSLIVGDSRSILGIHPSVINKELEGQYDLPILNYSFTVAQAAYGDAMFESVKKKLDPDVKNGLFVLNVTPALFAQRKGDDYAKGEFFETDMPPHNMVFPSMNPNVEYFFRNFSYFHFKAIIKRNSKMHKDGLLEEFYVGDEEAKKQWKTKQIKRYRRFFTEWKRTDFRLNKFREMVSYLDERGTVVLVRMPIDPELIEIENKFWPEFDADMQKIASESGTRYINFLPAHEKFAKYDGIHLNKSGGIEFTSALCDSIKKKP